MKNRYLVLVNDSCGRHHPAVFIPSVIGDNNLRQTICSNIIHGNYFTESTLEDSTNVSIHIPNQHIHAIVEFTGEQSKIGF